MGHVVDTDESLEDFRRSLIGVTLPDLWEHFKVLIMEEIQIRGSLPQTHKVYKRRRGPRGACQVQTVKAGLVLIEMDARQRNGQRYLGGTNKYIRDMSHATPKPDGTGCRPPGTHKLRDWRKDARQWMRFKRSRTLKMEGRGTLKEELSGVETSSPSPTGSPSPSHVDLPPGFGQHIRAGRREWMSPFINTARDGRSMPGVTDLPTPMVAPIDISKLPDTAKYELSPRGSLTFGYGKAHPSWAKTIPPPPGPNESLRSRQRMPPFFLQM